MSPEAAGCGRLCGGELAQISPGTRCEQSHHRGRGCQPDQVERGEGVAKQVEAQVEPER
jgi:hypothetical protein